MQPDLDLAEDLNVFAICERFGWTVEYVRGMAWAEREAILGYMDGQGKAQAHKAEKWRRK